MKDRERFINICRALWGDEWHRHAAAHLGKSRRAIIYWAKGDFEPVSWEDVFISLLSACNDALNIILVRRAAIDSFKRSYRRTGR